MIKSPFILVAALLSLLLTACSGGTGGTGVVAGGGTGGTGMVAVVSQGPIAEIGSIWVNGIEYDTTGATIYKPDGSSFVDTAGTAGGTELFPGMLVTVRGTRNADGLTGTATAVTYSNSLQGQVSWVDATTLNFKVYGQNVIVSANTRYHSENSTTWTPASGDWVAVSGYVSPDGQIQATFVQQITTLSQVEIKGVVSAVGSGQLTIGVTTVDVAPSVFNLALLAPGDVVEVKATAPTSAIATNLVAVSVERDGGLIGEDDDGGEIEGLIGSLPAANQLVVGGQHVSFDANTLFVGGVQTDLATGILVSVDGTLKGGVLVASKISFRSSLEMKSTIATVQGGGAPGSVITMTGMETLSIQIDDKTSIRSDVLTNGSLVAGKKVKVHARIVQSSAATAATLLATDIRLSDSTEVEFHGPLGDVAANYSTFEILGVTIHVPGLIYTLFDKEVPVSQFFGAVHRGRIIGLEGVLSNGQVMWTKVELED